MPFNEDAAMRSFDAVVAERAIGKVSGMYNVSITQSQFQILTFDANGLTHQGALSVCKFIQQLLLHLGDIFEELVKHWVTIFRRHKP